MDQNLKIEISPQEFEDRLRSCLPGKEHARVYEKLMTAGAYTIGKNEFSPFIPQCATYDNSYIMDAAGGLKGTTPSWEKYAIKFDTDFVVFEFKNYNKPLPRKTVQDCAKYLPNQSHRNVAFLFSRKGFSKSARTYAMSLLREGKVILELIDQDMLEMLRMEERGDDPSEYLWDKLQRMRISISV